MITNLMYHAILNKDKKKFLSFIDSLDTPGTPIVPYFPLFQIHILLN